MFVYVIKAAETGAYKFGYSSDPATRLKDLQTACPEQLSLVVTMPGGKQEESTHHTTLKQYRKRGEWFGPHPKVTEYVERLIATYGACPPGVGYCLGGVGHGTLHTIISSLEYKFDLRKLILNFPADMCCDMTGAICLAKTIDNDCMQIETLAGGNYDTAYLRHEGRDQEWKSYKPGRNVPVLPAYETDVNYVVWCDYCKVWHLHSKEDGQRVAHCYDELNNSGDIVRRGRDSPYKETEYYIVRIGYWPAWAGKEAYYDLRTPLARSTIPDGRPYLKYFYKL